MENKIKDLRQQLFDFKFNKSLNVNDFFVSDSNFYAYNLLLSWPKWEKKIINIFGERYSGKTHLIEIFLEKNKGLKMGLNELKNYDLDSLRLNENIIIEDLNEGFDETLFYSLIYEWKQTGKSKRLNDMLKQIPANKSDKKRICEL